MSCKNIFVMFSHGYSFNDLNWPKVDSNLRMPDGLHPNAKGHLKLATCLVNTSLNYTFGD